MLAGSTECFRRPQGASDFLLFLARPRREGLKVPLSGLRDKRLTTVLAPGEVVETAGTRRAHAKVVLPNSIVQCGEDLRRPLMAETDGAR